MTRVTYTIECKGLKTKTTSYAEAKAFAEKHQGTKVTTSYEPINERPPLTENERKRIALYCKG